LSNKDYMRWEKILSLHFFNSLDSYETVAQLDQRGIPKLIEYLELVAELLAQTS